MAVGKNISGKDSNLSISIIQDTREQKPWDFSIKLPAMLEIEDIVEMRLDAGDYSLVGYSEPENGHSICVERKRSVVELLGNIGQRWERFQRELVKLAHFDVKAIVVEDDLHKAHAEFKSNPYFNMPPEFIMKRIASINADYGVPTYFLTNRYLAQKFTTQLFKYFIIKYGS